MLLIIEQDTCGASGMCFNLQNGDEEDKGIRT